MNDEELALMLSLQSFSDDSIVEEKKSKNCSSNNVDGLSLIDPIWETIDPIPDVHSLFLQFDDRFFDSKLRCVEVKWSPRMTLCAGLCCYQGKGGLCSIRLSQSLLKFRPRKDLIETLLHEMIHAYLFVTDNNRDRDGHGPNFKYHMNRINNAAGTKITIYHSFHDEVNNYKVHWWRCNGPCQNRRPFYGFVKRSMNRAPGPNDLWWKDHSFTCGGTFTKIREPENYKNKNKQPKISMFNVSSSKSKEDIKSSVAHQKRSDCIDKFFTPRKKCERFAHIDLTEGTIVPEELKTSDSCDKNGEVVSRKSTPNLKRNCPRKEGCDIETFLTPQKNPKIVETIFDDSPDACSTSNLSQNEKEAYVFPGEGVRLGTMSDDSSKMNSLPDSYSASKNTIPSHCSSFLSNTSVINQDDRSVVQCPVCQKQIQLTDINAHLDICL